MNKFFRITLITAILLALSANAEGQRIIRSAGSPSVYPGFLDADEDSLIGYTFDDSLERFWTIPDAWGDMYYNVWFIPPFERSQLLEAHIPLYDIRDGGGNSVIGRPGLRVIVWNSVEFNEEPGFPGEEILASVDIPFDSLSFRGFGEEVFPNIIDLRSLELTFEDLAEFNIGVDVIEDEHNDQVDTLAIYSDLRDEFDNSRLYDSLDEVWKRTEDVPIRLEQGGERVYYKFNWGIWALVLDLDNPDNSVVLAPIRELPVAFSVDPAFPNPFNSGVRVRYYIEWGSPYSVVLHDFAGRQMQIVERGTGSGAGEIRIAGHDLAAGVYYLCFNICNISSTQRLVLTK